MAMSKKQTRALIGRRAILDHLGISPSVFKDLVKTGLPVSRRGTGAKQRWVGNADELDAWFRSDRGGGGDGK